MQSSFSTAQPACQGPLQEHSAPTQVTMSSCLEGHLHYSNVMLHFWGQSSMLFWAATFPHSSRKDYLLTSRHQRIDANAIAWNLIILLSTGDEDVAALEEEAGRKFVYAIRFTVICVLLGMAIKIFPSLGRHFLFLGICTAKKQGLTLFWQQLLGFCMFCTALHHANYHSQRSIEKPA